MSVFSGLNAIGETQATPTTYTLLSRVKALLTGIVLATGTNSIGTVGLNTGTNSAGTVGLDAGTNLIGKVIGSPLAVIVTKAIDASVGAYTAGDMVNDDDCCTTASPWTFAGMAPATGGYGVITGASLFNETENQAVQYDLILFNVAAPAGTTGQYGDNFPNEYPAKADRLTYVATISFPSTVARGALIATTTEASPSTTGGLPKFYKCAAGSTSLYGILVTRTAYTQTATDDITITLQIEHLNA